MKDWEELALEAHFRVFAVAKIIGISERTLRRHIRAHQHLL